MPPVFFAHLLKNIYVCSDVDKILLLGDFNARIGLLEDSCNSFDDIPQRKPNIDTIVNHHGHEFIDFLLDSRMAILNGRDKESGNDNRYTFVAGRGSSVVDYICVPYDNFSSISNFSVITPNELILKFDLFSSIYSASSSSDHNIIVADVNMSYTIDLRKQLSILSKDNAFAAQYKDEQFEKRYNNDRVKWKARTIPENFLQCDRVQDALVPIIDSLMLHIDSQTKLDNIYDNFIDLLVNELWNNVPYFKSDRAKRRYRINKPFWNQHLQTLWHDLYNVENDLCGRRVNKGIKKRFVLEYRHKLKEFDMSDITNKSIIGVNF